MKQITVLGMSCAHCQKAVTEALTELGLEDVKVELATGIASFAENAAVSEQAILEAIDDAGFEAAAIS